MNPSEIIRFISVAFSGVPRPDYTLADAAVADQWGKQSARFREHDHTWEEVTDDQIARTTAAFCFLPLASWKYYIPAYMRWTVRHIHNYKTETPTHLVHTLTTDAQAAAFRDSLTPNQRQAVAAFLDFWCNEHSEWTTKRDCSIWTPNVR